MLLGLLLVYKGRLDSGKKLGFSKHEHCWELNPCLQEQARTQETHLRLARIASRIFSFRSVCKRWCSLTYMYPTAVSGSAAQKRSHAFSVIPKFSP